MVYGQAKGAVGVMDYTPFTKFDGEIQFTGPSEKIDDKGMMSGRFCNLLSS
jgi:hypothetical protein